MLGVIINEKMILSRYGEIVAKEIIASCELRKECKIDKFVIMPNHIHMILIVHPVDGLLKTTGRLPAAPTQNQSVCAKFVRGFKGATSRAAGFSIWQRSYHDHIIRNKNEYHKIAQYIENNPKNWGDDCYYPFVGADGNRPADAGNPENIWIAETVKRQKNGSIAIDPYTKSSAY
jgi:REP element-mobilizing transposase RayT